MYQVILFYKYVTIEDPAAPVATVRELAQKHQLLGRVLIADEGINGTLEGTVEQTEAFIVELLKDERLSDMNIKRSQGTGSAFAKLVVKVRNEIVGTRFDKNEIDPRVRTAPHVSARDMHQWYRSEKDFVVVDMRNDFEFQSGHFKNSINPGLRASRDLPDAMDKLEPYKDKTVVTVCTGGVRCEKMSAYLLHKGFTDVYQLENGMHTYMEEFPGEDFLGTLYTFDGRVVMDFGGDREIVGTCRLCGGKTERYVNCANQSCHLHFLVCDSCATPDGAYCSAECHSIH